MTCDLGAKWFFNHHDRFVDSFLENLYLIYGLDLLSPIKEDSVLFKIG